MRGSLNRALIFAAGVVAVLAAGAPSLALASSDAAPRLAGSFSLDLPALMPALAIGPQDISRYGSNEITSDLALLDGISLEAGVDVDVTRMLERYAPSGYDGLFYANAALASPYAALSNGGSYVGGNLALANDLQLSVGMASSGPGLNTYLLDPRLGVSQLGGMGLPYDGRSTSSLVAGASWNFARWGGLGFTASQTSEHGGVLGDTIAAVDLARTTSLGFSAHLGFGGGWVTTVAYSQGTTQLDLKPGAFSAGGETDLHSEAYGIAVAKRGLFGNDALGLAFSRPAPSYEAGSFTSGSSGDMQFQFFGRDKLFAGTAPETDIDLGYITTFLNGPVALQANASYQMNAGGQNGNNGVSLLSRAKIKF